MNNKNFTRVMAIILAALMVLGALAITISSIWTVGALEIDDTAVEASDTLEAEDETSSASSLSGKLVRVGLFFRNSSYDLLRMNHSISSQTGFRFYMTDDSGDEIVSFSSPVKSVSVVREDNVYKNTKGVYEKAESIYTADIYTFAFKMKDSFPNDYSLKQEIAYAVSKNGYEPFYPIFDGGAMYLGMGDYSTSQGALDRFAKISSIYNREFAFKQPKDTYITVIDNETGKIVLRADTANYGLKIEPNYMSKSSDGFETEDDEGDILGNYVPSMSPGALGMEIDIPVIEYDTIPYITTAVGNIYAGTFEYKATSDGLTLTNILTLDDYVKSVVPFEIYNNWPEEAIKAFSIVSRTYALSTFHSGADFDMCSETHCQAYLGRGRSTEYSDACVDAVAGQILTYNGEPAKTFYHAISGGATESAANVWGGSTEKYPYLISVNTPEEKYSSYKNGLWSTAVTMDELSDYIRSKESYSNKFTSDIKDISIIETTPAGYIYKVLLTDADGNEVEVKTTDKVRILLSKFVKSANFIITHGIPIIKAGSLLATLPTDKDYPVLTAGGQSTINASDTLFAVSSDGIASPIKSDGALQIIGKGYGHGVGLSQYGTRDMAEMGYSYDKILSIYFPGTAIATYLP